MKRSIKRAWILTMTAVLVICMFAVPVFADYQELLSEMPDEQMMAELEKMGLEIPESFLNDKPEELLALIRFFVEELEKDPRFEAGFSLRETTILFQRIKIAALRYYGWPRDVVKEAEKELGRIGRNGLTDSTYYSYGDSSQNCYGYAINQNVYEDPGCQELLSEMPDEQMMAELEKMGLEIPESFLDDRPEERASLARWLIKRLEDDPGWVFAVGRADLYEYYLSIKNAVFKYYGWPEEYYLSKENSDKYQLQNSTYYSTGSASKIATAMH